jgi:choline monooxygenase
MLAGFYIENQNILRYRHYTHFFLQFMLTPNVYFDEEIFAKEQTLLFENGPWYVGHADTVRQVGDFSVLKHEQNGRMLVHTESGIQLISNICRHRQAIMHHDTGNTKHITCPLHKWSWKLSGEMQWAPHFEKNPCMHLRTWELQNWRWLLFTGKRDIHTDLKDVWFFDDICFEAYRYHSTEYHTCHYNWKSFMEVYGDDYHVAPFHPGLGKMVSLKNLEWTFWENWHIQTVGSAEILDSKTTPIYEHWRKKCLEQGNGKLPRYGAIWFVYYPNVMIEVYPYTITVSTLYPISPTETMNVVEFFYHHDISESLITAERAAYMETAIEDDDIAERMDTGRKILRDHATNWWHTSEELSWPCHPHLEAGTEHFMRWWERRI